MCHQDLTPFTAVYKTLFQGSATDIQERELPFHFDLTFHLMIRLCGLNPGPKIANLVEQCLGKPRLSNEGGKKGVQTFKNK